MPNEILITGAPGNVGTPVVKTLQRMGVDCRVGAFDVGIARAALGPAVELVPFDFLDSSTYAAALSGIRRLFLVRPPALSQVQKQIAPALHAAAAAGVKQVVFLSLQGVEHNRFVPHYKIEKLLQTLGIGYTFLRASFFMQNLSTTHRQEIAERGEIALPVGRAQTSFIDTRDIAAVAAQVLTEDGHDQRAYTLTGAAALDYFEVARIMSEVLGRPIRYTHSSALAFFRRQIAGGTSAGFALVMTGLYTITRFGSARQVTPDVEQLLHRPPISFRQFVEDHRAVWVS
jgi:uncharacterized protein YbjT (DUF2867 family)